MSVTTGLLTETETDDWPTLFDVSYAFTVSVCVPFAAVEEFQGNENGEVASASVGGKLFDH